MNERRKLPSKAELRKLFDYDPESGMLWWKPRNPNTWARPSRGKSWNTRYANKPALQNVDSKGYLRGNLFDRRVGTHRVIWKWMTGREPDMIDHVDGNRQNNRFSNLRSTNTQGNARNARRPSNNTSGVVGVSWLKREQKWEASIAVDRRKITLLRTFVFEEAVAARKAAEQKYGFHKNHGRD